MGKQNDLQRLASDPAAFRASLMIDAGGLQRRFGEVVEPFQDRDFLALDPAWRRLVGQSVKVAHSRAWLERPRGHSKTQDLAVSVLWALFASRRPLRGVVAAADRDQGRLLLDAIERIVRLNPWLHELVKIQKERVINQHTGSELQVLTSDVAHSFGLLVDFVCCDEVTHWRDRDLFDSLLSAVAKKNHALLLGISNAGWQQSWQWQLREAVRTDKRWYFSRLDSPAATWISSETLDEQQRLLPAIAYRRLWENVWSSGSGDAITESDIDAATVCDLPQGRQDGETYVGALDIGLVHDATSWVVIGKRADGRLAVRLVRRWQAPKGGKLDLSVIEQAIDADHRMFRLKEAALDPWQGSYLCSRLRAMGVPIIERPQQGARLVEQAMELVNAFREQRIDIPCHADLVRELKRLRIEEKSYGCRIVSDRTSEGHGDIATSLSIALAQAKSLSGRSRTFFSVDTDSDLYHAAEYRADAILREVDAMVNAAGGYMPRASTLGDNRIK